MNYVRQLIFSLPLQNHNGKCINKLCYHNRINLLLLHSNTWHVVRKGTKNQCKSATPELLCNLQSQTAHCFWETAPPSRHTHPHTQTQTHTHSETQRHTQTLLAHKDHHIYLSQHFKYTESKSERTVSVSSVVSLNNVLLYILA